MHLFFGRGPKMLEILGHLGRDLTKGTLRQILIICDFYTSV